MKRLAIGIVNPDSLAKAAEQDTLSLQFRFITGFVIFIENDRAFVNVGSEDGVRKGMELFVYSQAQGRMGAPEIGTLEVLEVRGPHLSLAQIRRGKGVIKERDRVRVKVLE